MRNGILIHGFLFWSVLASGQISLPLTDDPRAFALGGVGSLDGFWYQANGHPAVLGHLEKSQIGSHVLAPYGVDDLGTANLVAGIRSGFGGFGTSVAVSGTTGFRTVITQLAFGHRLWNRFSAGAGLDLVYLDQAEYGHLTRVGINLGAILPLHPTLWLGVTVRNPTLPWSTGPDRLPPSLQATLAYTPSEVVQLTAEWVQTSGTEADIRIGLRYLPVPSVPVRIGFQSLTRSFTAGAGYIWQERLSIDIAAAHHPWLGFTPVAGIRYFFTRPS